MTSSERDTGRSTASRAVDWWCRDRTTGEIVLGQSPNPAIVVWVGANVVRLSDVVPERERELGWIGTGAIVVWGLDELVRGVNPFRRALGAVVLGWQLVRLVAS